MRQPSWGTPFRSKHYMPRRPVFALIGLAVGLALGTFVVLTLLDRLGARKLVSPGHVTSAHAGLDSRCEACHATFRGALDLRCQRCHDSGGAGRLDLAAHVYFGSGNLKQAATAGRLQCARCHVEHGGDQAKLSAVDEAQCLRCHAALRPSSAGQSFRISSLASHPEFKLLRDKLEADPRLLFSHKRHMKEMIKEGAAGEWETCIRCHVPEAQGRDLQRIDYEPHCARCHTEGELTMPAVPLSDVQEDVALRAAGGSFVKTGTTIQKTGLKHKDEWILFNLRKLQAEVYPAAYGRDRDALRARASQLERRLYQAESLVGLPLDALEAREKAVNEEVRRLTARIAAVASGSDPSAGLARLNEAGQAAAAGDDARARTELAEALERARQVTGGASSAPLSPEEFEARRQELLGLLDALAAADKSRARSVDDLRRRLLALAPGESSKENLERALVQRRADLERIEDEIRLRRASVPAEVRALPERLALEAELRGLRDQLAKFYSFAPGGALSEADRTRKQATLVALTGEGSGERCAKCHLVKEGSLLAPRPARLVMTRATFAHRKHLDAPLPQLGLFARLRTLVSRSPAAANIVDKNRYRCAYCHESVVAAGDAPRAPAVPGVQNCRECHRGGATRQDCQLCHRYHPPGDAS